MSAIVEKPTRVVYTAKTHTTGGREKGVARSSGGRLEVRLSVPGTPVDAAEQTCPYSKAIRGNVNVTVKVV